MPPSSSYKTGARPKRACETEIPIKQLLEWMNDIFCVSAKKHFEGEILRNINILKTKIVIQDHLQLQIWGAEEGYYRPAAVEGALMEQSNF